MLELKTGAPERSGWFLVVLEGGVVKLVQARYKEHLYRPNAGHWFYRTIDDCDHSTTEIYAYCEVNPEWQKRQ